MDIYFLADECADPVSTPGQKGRADAAQGGTAAAADVVLVVCGEPEAVYASGGDVAGLDVAGTAGGGVLFQAGGRGGGGVPAGRVYFVPTGGAAGAGGAEVPGFLFCAV